MEKIRLIGLDLDGTLLDGKKNITPGVYRALEEAAARGVFLVPVTGRPFFGVPKNVREEPLFPYIISCNGASIWDRGRETILREGLISHQESLPIVELLTSKGIPFEVLYRGLGYAEAWVYERMIAASPNSAFLIRYIEETRRKVESVPAFLKEDEKALEELYIMSGSGQRQRALLEELGQSFDVSLFCPFPAAIEVTARGVDKGEALLHLAAHLEIPKAGVMAMGDSGNDLAMLRAAGLPVAMGNSSREVLELVSHVTATNEEDGVALAIRRFVLDA